MSVPEVVASQVCPSSLAYASGDYSHCLSFVAANQTVLLYYIVNCTSLDVYFYCKCVSVVATVRC